MMSNKIISNTISITIFSILISGTTMFPEKVLPSTDAKSWKKSMPVTQATAQLLKWK